MSLIQNDIFNENLQELRVDWLAEHDCTELDIKKDSKGEYIIYIDCESIEDEQGIIVEQDIKVTEYLPTHLQDKNFI